MKNNSIDYQLINQDINRLFDEQLKLRWLKPKSIKERNETKRLIEESCKVLQQLDSIKTEIIYAQ